MNFGMKRLERQSKFQQILAYIIAILLAFAFVLKGCGINIEHDPAKTVTVEISQISLETDRERVKEILKGMTDGSNHLLTSTWSGDKMTVKLSPVTNVKAFSRKINFGTVTEVNQRTVKVEFVDDLQQNTTKSVDSTTVTPKPQPLPTQTQTHSPNVTPKIPQRVPSNNTVNNYVVDRSTLNDPEWQRAIDIISQRPGIKEGRGTKVTLGRIFWEGARPGERIQLVSTKLNSLKPSSTGGGRFKEIENGGFFVVEHINSKARQNYRDPVEIGAYFHSRPTLWVDVPSGQLGILGDVWLYWSPVKERGILRLVVQKPANISLTTLKVGPAIVGGPYGRDFAFNSDLTLEIPNINPGTYKLLFPEFNYQKSRWTVTIEPGKVTELDFVARSQTLIEKVNERKVPAF